MFTELGRGLRSAPLSCYRLSRFLAERRQRMACPPSTAAPTGFGGCRWGDRAGRVIAGKHDPMKQVGSARAVATSKGRIRAARHEASARIARHKADRRQRTGESGAADLVSAGPKPARVWKERPRLRTSSNLLGVEPAKSDGAGDLRAINRRRRDTTFRARRRKFFDG